MNKMSKISAWVHDGKWQEGLLTDYFGLALNYLKSIKLCIGVTWYFYSVLFYRYGTEFEISI